MWCFDSLEPRKLWRGVLSLPRRFWKWSKKETPTTDSGRFSYSAVPLRSPQWDFEHSAEGEAKPRTILRDSSRVIRLLRVVPSSQDGSIVCHMRVVDLNHEPYYEALSYTWGPTTRAERERGITSTPKYPIVCNDGRLLVTENLYHWLQKLDRDACYGKDIWVDAICINQDDPDERCQQVSIMADIYRSAARVAVWLGDADDSTKLAHELIAVLSQLSHEDMLTIDPQKLDNERNVCLLGRANSPDHWRALALLFGRTYFNRAWVIQEILLARDTTVLCGDHIFNWDAMVAVSHFLATRTSANIFKTHLFDNLDASSLSYKNPTKLAAVKRDIDKGSSNVLLHSLVRCRTYQASNDHDKVYALLGLAAPIHGSFPDSLYPDYTCNVAQLYTDVVAYILRTTDDLHVLAYAEGDDFQRIPDIPSWVPDWSLGARVGLGITGYKRFEAAGTLPTVKDILPGNRLAVLGGQINVISRTGATKAEVNSTESPADWLQILEELEREYPGRDLRDAFWRTLIADTDTHGHVPVKERWEDAFYVWMKLHENPSPDDRQHAAEFEMAFTHSLNLRLFRTALGHLGLGSTSCRPGDLVWIVQGSRVPLILRQAAQETAADHYRLVGGAYLHGYMQGEGLEGWDSRRITLV
ncbi:HET-domain-containing protein [Xylariomycetidae sp. FL2044]|nr:HET-domain-containing protein [Xylariomycetidae sp. FL2044]